jgi:hypothetical protein
MSEDWKLQVSYKTSTGDMINIRAHTAETSVIMQLKSLQLNVR